MGYRALGAGQSRSQKRLDRLSSQVLADSPEPSAQQPFSSPFLPSIAHAIHRLDGIEG
jgi:hypothetical protein